MQRDSRAWLWDVREAASCIEQFTDGLNADDYARTPLVYSAVERKFEIIGEALNQMAKARPDLASRIPYLPQIVAFRNQLSSFVSHEQLARLRAKVQTKSQKYPHKLQKIRV